MLCILKALAVWIALMLVGANLIGLLVRGLVSEPPGARMISGQDPIPKNRVLDLLFAAIVVAYVIGLYHWLGLTIAAAASILMATRVPDLLREIRTGEKAQLGDHPDGALDKVTLIITWSMILVIGYGLCG